MTRRRLLLSLALANAACIWLWYLIWAASSPRGFLLQVDRWDGARVFVLVLLLATMLAVARPWADASERGRRVAAALPFLFAFGTGLDGLRKVLETTIGTGGAMYARWVPVLGVLAAAALLLRNPRAAWRAARAVSVAMVPLLVPAVSIAVLALREPAGPAARSTRSAVPTAVGARRVPVRFIIFDELDYRRLFGARDPQLRVPAFDRLRREALVFTNVRSPAANTIESIPSMLTGARVRTTRLTGRASARLALEDGRDLPFGDGSVLDSTLAQGGTIGFVGWFIPYCRLRLASRAARCAWQSMFWLGDPAEESGAARLVAFLGQLSPLGRRLLHVDLQRHALREAERLAGDPAVDVAWLHLPMPHAPFLFDGSARRFAPLQWRRGAYDDNLVLADSALTAIRAAMERTGLWSRALVVVTSDHPWRDAARQGGRFDPRIPLLVKLPASATAGPPGTVTAEVPPEQTTRLLAALLPAAGRGADDVVRAFDDWRTTSR